VTAAPSDGPAPPDNGAASGLSMSRYDSFVVRVLSDPREGTLLGGRVTHVATRRTLSFTDVQRIVTFIHSHVGTRPGVVDKQELDQPSAGDLQQ
jgi:hypothetical protein